MSYFSCSGFMVIIPDYFRGKYYDRMNPDFDLDDFISDFSDWNKLKKDFSELILPFAKTKGAQMFGTVGKCRTIIILRT